MVNIAFDRLGFPSSLRFFVRIGGVLILAKGVVVSSDQMGSVVLEIDILPMSREIQLQKGSWFRGLIVGAAY